MLRAYIFHELIARLSFARRFYAFHILFIVIGSIFFLVLDGVWTEGQIQRHFRSEFYIVFSLVILGKWFHSYLSLWVKNNRWKNVL